MKVSHLTSLICFSTILYCAPWAEANDSSESDDVKRRFDSIAGSSGFAGFGKRDKATSSESETERELNDWVHSSKSDKGPIQSASENAEGLVENGSEEHDIPTSRGDGNYPSRTDLDKEEFLNLFNQEVDPVSSPEVVNTDKRRFDSITGGGFNGFGKRRFDSIGGSSSFHGFGKRRFDAIGGSSSFHGFGKRNGEDSGEVMNTDKRRFDSIGGSSSFHGFGKRRFDSIGGSSSFHGFGKRNIEASSEEKEHPLYVKYYYAEQKRPFDRIGGSSFSSFAKRQDELVEDVADDTSESNDTENEKRRFDSISGVSSFGSFGKKNSGEVKSSVRNMRKKRSAEGDISLGFAGDAATGTPSVSKRRFDKIDTRSSFRRWGKRSLSNNHEEPHGLPSKRRFDKIGSSSSFSGFGKRSFDRIGGSSGFTGFGKRSFDKIGGSSSFHGFGKRRFDPIGGSSSFHGFGKRAFDKIGGSGFSGFGGKRSFDRIGGSSGFAGFGKRSFDRIGGSSSFSGFGKRGETTVDVQNIPDVLRPEVLAELLYQSGREETSPSPEQVLATALLEELLLQREKVEDEVEEEEEEEYSPFRSYSDTESPDATQERQDTASSEKEALLQDLLELAERMRGDQS